MLQVISFPKSGRTWLRVMLDDVGISARYSHDDSWIVSNLSTDKAGLLGANVLLLVRDPRDTAVSAFFQATRGPKLRAAPLQYLKLEIRSLAQSIRDHRTGINRICSFNLQWFVAARQIDRFAILSYEQMHESPKTALIAVAGFAGSPLDDGIAQQVADNRAFARMRAAEASGELAQRYGRVFYPQDINDPESFKLRRGIIGGYRDYLSKADLAYCEAILAETGYWPRANEALTRWGLIGRSNPNHA